jgi:hypothetical protein
MSRFPTIPASFPETTERPAVSGTSTVDYPVQIAAPQDISGNLVPAPTAILPAAGEAIRHQIPEAASSL